MTCNLQHVQLEREGITISDRDFDMILICLYNVDCFLCSIILSFSSFSCC